MLYYITEGKTGKLKEIYCEAPYKFCDNKDCPCHTDQGPDNIDEVKDDSIYDENNKTKETTK